MTDLTTNLFTSLYIPERNRRVVAQAPSLKKEILYVSSSGSVTILILLPALFRVIFSQCAL